jgi:hypothetical protein
VRAGEAGGGGESGSSSSASSEASETAIGTREASETAIRTAFENLSKMVREHNELYPNTASAPQAAALCCAALPVEGGGRLSGLDFQSNARYFPEFLDLFKAAHNVTDETTLHAAQGRATGRRQLYT